MWKPCYKEIASWGTALKEGCHDFSSALYGHRVLRVPCSKRFDCMSYAANKEAFKSILKINNQFIVYFQFFKNWIEGAEQLFQYLKPFTVSIKHHFKTTVRKKVFLWMRRYEYKKVIKNDNDKNNGQIDYVDFFCYLCQVTYSESFSANVCFIPMIWVRYKVSVIAYNAYSSS